MLRADRRFLQAIFLAWLVVYTVLVLRFLRTEVSGGAKAYLVGFGIVFLGVVAALLTSVAVAIPLRIVLNLTIRHRRRSHRTETILLATVLILVIGYELEVQRERNRLEPPQGVTRLSDFAKAMSPPHRLELMRKDGSEYVVWFGELSGPIDIPSGHSCYLFDRNGDLLKWQPETGDGGPVDEFLRSSSNAGEITIDGALNIGTIAVSFPECTG